MKTLSIVLSAAMLGIAPPIAAQTRADSAAIRAAALDYIEGWYTGDGDRMARALHPDLAKRIVWRREGKEELDNMTADELIEATRRGGGSRTPEAERRRDVTVLDVFRNAAVAKVVARDWVDYLQLAKWGDRWVIVNVLWELKES